MDKLKPIVVIADRYDGLYSGAKYIAWHLDKPPPDSISDDIETVKVFWCGTNTLCGKGNTPEAASNDLYIKYQRIRLKRIIRGL